jgi:hypothetical protein
LTAQLAAKNHAASLASLAKPPKEQRKHILEIEYNQPESDQNDGFARRN